MEENEQYMLTKAKSRAICAKEEHRKKLEKEKVPIYGTLRTNVKDDDIIRAMSININGLPMNKRFNHKADRLREVISRYHLDVVGIQEVKVNWDEFKASNTLGALLRKGSEPIRSKQLYNKHKTKNIGKLQRGGTATVLQGRTFRQREESISDHATRNAGIPKVLGDSAI